MKFQIYFFLIFLFVTNILLSQDLNNIIKIEYDFYLNLGENQIYNSTLYFSKNKSLFSWGEIKNDNNDNKSNDFSINLSKQDSIGTYNYTDYVTDSIYTRFTLFDNKTYLLVEKRTDIKWEILKETKKINDYNCHLAKTKFRGRVYFAWFTTEFPFNASPWKLSGLPGVILEAFTQDNKIRFILKKVKEIKQGNIFELPKENYEKISVKQYSVIQGKLANDFKNKIMAKLPRGAKIEIKNSESIEIFNN